MRRSVDWCGPAAGVVRRVVWAAKSGLQSVCIFRLFRVSNLRAHRTESVFALKSIVGWGENKVVLDASGFRAYCVGVKMKLKIPISLYVQCYIVNRWTGTVWSGDGYMYAPNVWLMNRWIYCPYSATLYWRHRYITHYGKWQERNIN